MSTARRPDARRLLGALAAALFPLGAALAAPPLATYNVDPTAISISGLSAGGFAAMQMGIAYSSLFSGVAILAGGPYDCARAADYLACLNNSTPPIAGGLASLRSWSGTKVDDLSHIASQRIYLFTGLADTTVGPSVVGQVERFYVTTGALVAAANLKYDRIANIVHTYPTSFKAAGDNPCSLSTSPYISDCGFDGAGAALQWIYGTLKAPAATPPTGQTIQFDQTEFIAAGHGADASGWIYVPAACAGGARCRLHLALHGCLQAHSMIGARFINNAGYLRWADANQIIVLFPQAIADFVPHLTASSGWLPNPEACWDWIGWYGNDFDQKSGVQMAGLAAMVGRVAGLSVSAASNKPAAGAVAAPGAGCDRALRR